MQNQAGRIEPISKEAILRQAARLFREKGYRATSLEDVAAVFGVSRPAIYYYFKSKQEILAAIHRQARGKLYDAAWEIFKQPLSTEKKFRRLIENFIYTIATEAIMVGIFYEEEKELDPEYVDEVKATRKKYTEEMIKLYTQGVKEKVFTPLDPKLVVFSILGSCNWVYRWFREEGDKSAEEVARLMAEFFARGYLL